MIIKRLFVVLFTTVFVASAMMQATTETRLQARKRSECETKMKDMIGQGAAQGGDVKRHSPDMPVIGALSLAQEGPVAFVAANELKSSRINIIDLFKSGRGLADVTLKASDLENLALPADALNCAPENKNVGTSKSFIQGVIRWLVHDALQSKDKIDANVCSNVALLSDKCDIIAVRDLMVEASMVDCTDVVALLIKRAYSLEEGQPSASTYKAMAMGYRAASFPQKRDKLPENMTARCFRAMFQDKKFAKAVEDFK